MKKFKGSTPQKNRERGRDVLSESPLEKRKVFDSDNKRVLLGRSVPCSRVSFFWQRSRHYFKTHTALLKLHNYLFRILIVPLPDKHHVL